MLHRNKKETKKITNRHFIRGSRSRTDKYDYKETCIPAYDYKELSVYPINF